MTNEEKAKAIMADFPNDHTKLSQEMYDIFIEKILQMAEWKDEQELKFLQELCVHSNLGIVFEKMQNRIKELKN